MTTETLETAPAELVDEPNPTAPDSRVPGFTIGDTVYTFPAHVPPGWALTYLRLYYSSGEDHAMVWALNRLLGFEQLNRLEADPALTRDALAAAVDACKRALLGELEDPKGS